MKSLDKFLNYLFASASMTLIILIIIGVTIAHKEARHALAKISEIQELTQSSTDEIAFLRNQVQAMSNERNEREKVLESLIEKSSLLEESLNPANTRWAKIKKVRAAVKKSQEELGIGDMLGSIGRTTYASAVVDYSEKFDVEVSLILAMTRRESAFNPKAVSHAGAQGMIQIMPATAKEIAADLGVRHYSMFKIRDNVKFGVFYIMKMIDDFDGKIPLAVRAYNCGPTYVRKVLGGEYRDYPSETREYVRKILGDDETEGYVSHYKKMGL